MKHRSVGIFIILAASLAAIPQASQELVAFKDAVGERVRVEIWQAFLDLNSQGRGSAPVSPERQSEVASCPDTAKDSAKSVAKKTEPRKDEARVAGKESGQKAPSNETARMIVDPAQDPRVAKAPTPATSKRALKNSSAADFSFSGEYAMVVPPALDVNIDALTSIAPQLRELGRARGRQHAEIARVERLAASDVARAKQGRTDAQRTRTVARRLVKEGMKLKSMDEEKAAEFIFKALKFNPAQKHGVVTPVALFPQPARPAPARRSGFVAPPAPPVSVGE